MFLVVLNLLGAFKALGTLMAVGLMMLPAVAARFWPYRSLTNRGFVTFIAITATMLLVPLLALLGTELLWAITNNNNLLKNYLSLGMMLN